MTTNEYLTEVLKQQDLGDDSQEMKDLRAHRDDVEALLRKEFSESSPTIRYGGSKAKGTLNRESYDLDIICYFPSDETAAGESLKEIYENVKKALEKEYFVEPKNSSLRLMSRDLKKANRDFHIDVVPGRYVDDSKGDCFIHQNNADKERMKTNLQVHIDHVRDSGVVDAVRLLKLWKARRMIAVKQFVWELLVIDLLKDEKSSSLEDQLVHVWETIRDSEDPINVEDPANPNGNDLSEVISQAWPVLRSNAKSALDLIEASGWESVFGSVKRAESATARVAALASAAASATVSSRPWST
jgi:tRNA nucleotidyltransferase (CCA-adding enzyme)